MTGSATDRPGNSRAIGGRNRCSRRRRILSSPTHSTPDGRPRSTAEPATIYPAYCAFRAVYLPQGKHSVVFQYSPAGFKLGLVISLCGMLAGLVLWFLPRRSTAARRRTHAIRLAAALAESGISPLWSRSCLRRSRASVRTAGSRLRVAGRRASTDLPGAQASRPCSQDRSREPRAAAIGVPSRWKESSNESCDFERLPGAARILVNLD